MRISDFDLYKDLLKEKSGLTLTPDKSYLLDSRLTPVARKWNYNSLEVMTMALRAMPPSDLVKDVVEAMTTNETSFYRDSKPFEQFRDITTPIVDYLQRIRLESPRDLVAVYLPEYVVSHWWEELLHNQSALRLKLRLRLMGNVMLTSVPYVLDGADDPKNTDDDGEPTRPRVAPITP